MHFTTFNVDTVFCIVINLRKGGLTFSQLWGKFDEIARYTQVKL